MHRILDCRSGEGVRAPDSKLVYELKVPLSQNEYIGTDPLGVEHTARRNQHSPDSHVQLPLGLCSGVTFAGPARSRAFLLVRRACAAAWGCKSPAQPDGG